METPNTSEAKPLSSETPKKKPKTAMIILIVILALGLICSLCGVGGYFAYKYFSIDSSSTDSDSEETSDSDVIEENETCEDLWWFDDSSTSCEQDEFCGMYMYEGLQTFENLTLCQNAFVDENGSNVEDTGIIIGSVGYPSEYIPEDMMVCADNTYTGSGYCEQIETGDGYTYGYGYEIEVPFGNYQVYAQVPGDTYKAYYSEYVTCGMNVDCTSHEPVVVTVNESSSTVTGIDPIDWYDN